MVISADIWHLVTRASFAVLGHVTPRGEPRSSGVVYLVDGGSMFVAVAKDSWKARQLADGSMVAVTVPIRRGGPLSLVFPIPPATISFRAVVTIHPGEVLDRMPRLARLVPVERRAGCTVLEIRPTGSFLTYGVGVSLTQMRDPARARARVAVT
jgi:hypothetical protein